LPEVESSSIVDDGMPSMLAANSMMQGAPRSEIESGFASPDAVIQSQAPPMQIGYPISPIQTAFVQAASN